MKPAPRAESFALTRGVVALPGGLAWLPACGALVAADAHLGYEDVVGAALPLWSTDEVAAYLHIAAERTHAREVIFLGDAIHGPRMHDGAARRVRAALASLRERVTVTIVAGNHEGAEGGAEVFGDVRSVPEAERDGWRLLHGDRDRLHGGPVMIGHLHPSLHLGGAKSVPVFLGSERIVVVPALTPYSSGLDVLSGACARAIGRWTDPQAPIQVVASTVDAVYPFGALGALRAAVRGMQPPANGFRSKARSWQKQRK